MWSKLKTLKLLAGHAVYISVEKPVYIVYVYNISEQIDSMNLETSIG